MKGKTALSFNALNLPGSMNFLGDCNHTFLKYNFMQGYTEAINLEGATLPDQFEMNAGSPAPLDNIWNDPPLNPGDPTDRVTGSISGVNPIEWYYQPGTDLSYNFSAAFFITFFGLVSLWRCLLPALVPPLLLRGGQRPGATSRTGYMLLL
jgi:hypothetical protein